MTPRPATPGRVQIGLAHNCLDYVLPFAYSARYQNVTGITVGLTVGPAELTLGAVAQGCLDFVITDRIAGKAGELTKETLYENPVLAICAPGHPLTSRKELMLADLVGQQCIVSGGMTKLELYEIFDGAGLPLPTMLRAGCSSLHDQIGASTQLIALRAVPTVLALADIRAHLAVLRIKDLTSSRPVFTIYRHSDHLSAAALRLIDDLKALAISETNLR